MAVFASRDLRWFMAAAMLISFALWAFEILVAVAAYEYGGVTAVGVVMVARLVPGAIVAAATAYVVDRVPRRDALAGFLAAGTALLAGLWLLAAASSAGPGLVAAVLFTCVFTGVRPAQAALLPALCDTPRELASANASWNAIENGGFLAGSVVGGIVAAASIPAGFAMTACVGLAAALVTMLVTRDHRPTALPAEGIVREITSGLREAVAAGRMRDAVGALGVLALIDGAMDVMTVAIAYDVLGRGAAITGWLSGAWGLGGLAGAALAYVLLGRGRFGAALALGALLAGGAAAVLGAAGTVAVALVLFVGVGVGVAVVETSGTTLVQRLASEGVLGRVFGAVDLMAMVNRGLGALAISALAAATSVQVALVVTGSLLPAWLVLRRRAVAALDAGAVVPEREFALLRSLDLFAPLPLATVETLAVRAGGRTVGPGDTVIREGEPGDRFYVVAAGTVEVTIDGAVVRRQGDGEYFGEIALLRDVPRTATVRALTPVSLLAVARDDFLFAVTGHAHASAVAAGVADERLTTAPTPDGLPR